ncbi:MAG: hypothetical protein LBT59_04330 [Clostridiales bacterium]|nr:hypothetical protein [Clostridiales bacterium]
MNKPIVTPSQAAIMKKADEIKAFPALLIQRKNAQDAGSESAAEIYKGKPIWKSVGYLAGAEIKAYFGVGEYAKCLFLANGGIRYAQFGGKKKYSAISLARLIEWSYILGTTDEAIPPNIDVNATCDELAADLAKMFGGNSIEASQLAQYTNLSPKSLAALLKKSGMPVYPAMTASSAAKWLVSTESFAVAISETVQAHRWKKPKGGECEWIFKACEGTV